MQSTLLIKANAKPEQAAGSNIGYALFAPTQGPGPVTRALRRRSGLVLALLYLAAAVMFWASAELRPFAASLIWPGGGFVITGHWLWAGLSAGGFALSMLLWFGTGNAAAPPLGWAVCAVAAQSMGGAVSEVSAALLFAFWPVSLGLYLGTQKLITLAGQRRRRAVNNYIIAQPAMQPMPIADELSAAEAAHMRLLLDRALQPAEDFNGFEKIDQFQTASMRYQVNAISYALSMASAQYLPAFSGYMHRAQENLRAKQECRQIWNYWAKESLWGNFENSPDPIVKDNIMYSGFTGLQIVMAQKTGALAANCRLTGHKTGQDKPVFDYNIDRITGALIRQYKQARLGLLPCEPNWVYPLCNAITAAAIKGYSPKTWDEISAEFRTHLSGEFLTASGKLIPFKSSYTGLSMAGIGGAVMQAFPCYFLSAICPDIAGRQWLALKHDAEKQGWKRQLWPVDVGNYGLSRASSYAATALAAREMGDHVIADKLLEMMNADCPLQTHNGAAHHRRASLWANAYAFMAKTGRAHGFRDLISQTLPRNNSGPALEYADYQQATVAKAKRQDDGLSLVLYPAQKACLATLKLSGLVPGAKFSIRRDDYASYLADENGQKTINVPVDDRTEFFITA